MIKTFNNPGTFQASYAAEAWLKENGYSVGTMCGKLPRGILKGDIHIAKWKNLTGPERKACCGTMFGDMRNGPVHVEIKGGAE